MEDCYQLAGIKHPPAQFGIEFSDKMRLQSKTKIKKKKKEEFKGEVQ